MGSDERIQGLSALKPVSLLKAFVAGRGYLVWPEDLALAGNREWVEASFLLPDASAPNVAYTVTNFHPNLVLLAFKLHWAHTDSYFWHAIVCNTPQTEASALAMCDLGLSLWKYYEANYTEIGEALIQMAQSPLPSTSPDWSARFFCLPRQLPSTLNSQTRTMLADVRKIMPAAVVPMPAQTQLSLQRILQWLAVLGWLVAGVLLLVFFFVLRG